MTNADLHVHCKHSLDGDEWFLKQIGARESYTEIEDVYLMAKMRKMDFVTLTDHNTIGGALELVRRHPEDCFTGVEVTVVFPEDNCKVHVLVYDLNEEQFAKIQDIRGNIYKFRDYIRSENLPYSVAHATFGVNGKLNMEVLEKLILLFDIFEGINGSRSSTHNRTWTKALDSLTPEDIQELYEKHKIEPFSKDPWIKGFTGGSDDHAGAFIGKTFTSSLANSRDEFLRSLRDKNTFAAGRNNNFKTMAFVFCKIGHEIANNGQMKKNDLAANILQGMILHNRPAPMRAKLTAWGLSLSRNEKHRITGAFLKDLFKGLEEQQGRFLDLKIDYAYDCLATLYDRLLQTTVKEFESYVQNGRAVKLVQKFFAMMPILLLSAPFFTTLRLLHQNRGLIEKLKARYIRSNDGAERTVLWLTDSVRGREDMPGFVKRVVRARPDCQSMVQMVISLPQELAGDLDSFQFVNLPPVTNYQPKFMKNFQIKIPSFLKSLAAIQKMNPDEIIVDTPGPLGILGLISARLLDIKCTGFFPLGSFRYLERILDHSHLDPDVMELFQKAARGFASLLDARMTRVIHAAPVFCEGAPLRKIIQTPPALEAGLSI